MHMYMHVCVCVCVCVCVRACMHACMHVCVCMYMLCMFAHMYVIQTFIFESFSKYVHKLKCKPTRKKKFTEKINS